MAIEIADELFNIADDLDRRQLYKFAEQLRAAGMSMSNNIAEGSGSVSNKDFRNFLNYAHRSTYENANILILIARRQLISSEQLKSGLNKLEILSRQITSFQKTLK